MAYNGWKNWETWNVALWLGNNEPLYRAAISTTKDYAKLNGRERLNADDAQFIVRDLLPNGTPDFRSEHHGEKLGAAHYESVDWNEIAADLNEMAFGA